MKKKVIALLAAVLMLTGCGESTTDPVSTITDKINPVKTLAKLDVDSYVTIGDYKGLKTEVEVSTVEDSILEGTLKYYYKQYVTEEYGLKEGVVQTGDTVNIAYEGKLDGVAFDGGTSDSYDLTIGSGTFIDGFEAGLIGVNVGDTVDLNLTFPETYGSEELAGKDVVFTVTVNYLLPLGNDEVAAIAASHMGITDVTTYDGLREAFRTLINDSYVEEAKTNAETEILNAFFDNCVYIQETPEFLVSLNGGAIETMMTESAELYGTDADTFCNYYYGKDLATLVDDTAPEQARQLLAMQVIANKEGLNVSDDELTESLTKDATENGYESVEAMTGSVSREYYRNYYMSEKVRNFIFENAEITYK